MTPYKGLEKISDRTPFWVDLADDEWAIVLILKLSSHVDSDRPGLVGCDCTG